MLFHILTTTFIGMILVTSAHATPGADIASRGNNTGATACASCHGTEGQGMAGTGFPRLAGQNASYLSAQLESFQQGERKNAIMGPIAKALSAEDVNQVATYYSGLDAPSTAKPADVSRLVLGKELATRGDWANRGLPACNQCHGPEGSGIGASFPVLAGQQADYIQNQIKAWQAGSRHNDPGKLMATVAKKLSDVEITAVASYYASLSTTGSSVKASVTTATTDKPILTDNKQSSPVSPTVHKDTRASALFTPPAHGNYPQGPMGEAVRRGEQIFRLTNSDPLSKPYVGNDQQCANCHIDAGRLADSAPMWAAWVAYPTYRSKNKRINDITMRVQGCFRYSMNAPASEVGHPPASDSEMLQDLLAYMYWLSTDAPTGDAHMKGRGYPKLKDTALGFDATRGKQVFENNCAICHGKNGEGVVRDGLTLFPPLWGDRAYNWGAGMHKISNAAAFIKANMPLGKGGSLSEQEAWDVAAYMNSMPRPQDPRYTGNLEETIKKYHKSKYDLYGEVQKAGKGLVK